MFYQNSELTNQLVRYIQQNDLLSPNIVLGSNGAGDYRFKSPLSISNIMENYIYAIANNVFDGNVVQHPNGTMKFPDLRIGEETDIDVKTYLQGRAPAFDIANKNFIDNLATGVTIDHLLGDYIVIPYTIEVSDSYDDVFDCQIWEDKIVPQCIYVYKLWEMVKVSDNGSFMTGGNAGALRPRNFEKTQNLFTGFEGMYEFLAAVYEQKCQNEGEDAANLWIDQVFIQLDEDPSILIPDDDYEW